MQLTYFTPGPGKLHPEFSNWMSEGLKDQIGSLSHRSKKFEGIIESTVTGLKRLLQIPDSHKVFFLGSATEAMERILQNVVEKNSFHFVNGAFSERFFETAQELGKSPISQKASLGEGFELPSASIPEAAELICITQNETSTGVWLPPEAITALANANPQKLIAVDFVSSVPIVELDFKSVDCAFFSVQKCFGLPAGLGVLIVSPRALDKANALLKKGISTGSYHSFQSLLRFAEKRQTPETPPVLQIYFLDKVIQSYLKVGITVLRDRILKRSLSIYTTPLTPLVKDPKFRSPTVVCLNSPDAKATLQKLLDAGFVVGEGYGTLKEKTFRIANFPVHTDEEIQRLLVVLNQR